MARVTFVAFALLTSFFYITGKPVNDSGQVINTFADYSKYQLSGLQTSGGENPNPLISIQKSSSQRTGRSRKNEQVRHRQLAKTTPPALPTRNPRRTTPPSPKYALSAPASPVKAPAKLIQVAHPDTTKTFRDGKNQFTGGTAKPLGVSYQQKYVKSQKPVLGPRLTAVLLKRELRRVGCYRGNVTSRWDESARAAIAFYNTSTGSNLTTKTPLVSSLETVQKTTKTVCVEQPVIEGAIIASAGQIQGQDQSTAKNALKTVKKASKWRTKVQYQKATFHPAPTTRIPRYEITRPRLIERYIAPPVPQARPRRKIRKHRIKRSKRIRVAKRKARRRTAVRSWRKKYRRKRFGFRSTAGSVSLNH